MYLRSLLYNMKSLSKGSYFGLDVAAANSTDTLRNWKVLAT